MTSLLLIAAIGQSCIAQQVAYQPVQYQQQAYNQAYVEKQIFVAVEDPASFYGGLVATQQRTEARAAQAQQTQSVTDAKIDRLTQIIEALQRRIEASEPPLPDKPATVNPPLPATTVPDAEAVPPPPSVAQASKRQHVGLAALTKSCAGCHQGETKAKGGFVMFATGGQFVANDEEDLARIEKAIRTARMPKKPNKQVTLAEYAAIRDFLGDQMSNIAVNTNPEKTSRR